MCRRVAGTVGVVVVVATWPHVRSLARARARADYVIEWLVERFAYLEYPAGAHCDFHPTTRFPPPPSFSFSLCRLADPVSSASHFPATPSPLPAIALHIPTVRSSGAFANPVTDPRRFIPTDNCISVHCYQPTRARRAAARIPTIYLQPEGYAGWQESRSHVMDVGEDNGKTRLGAVVFIMTG